ncbi:OLC1v1030083C1 [Oldenlandia corymbosa var. corymbosa]|uniref:OLC1v1030083C1 n=1 Tax=Oldenlandia corymbosa var. corymbosa TaxID=529605 RepID=A0AAV1CFZ8_OLDCO|nr:OLC1v1030083C1 [Oldenlandia corymbosa var. corymbosa]
MRFRLKDDGWVRVENFSGSFFWFFFPKKKKMNSTLVYPGHPDLHEIYQGKYDEKCSNHDFVTYMPGSGNYHEFSRPQMKPGQLKAFWSEVSEQTPTKRVSIQDRIKSLLASVEFSSDDILVQFWTPITTRNGDVMLSASEQPFGVGELYNGLCRYRYCCINQGNKTQDDAQLGPIGRVFRQGSPEYCPNIECYSAEEFPLRDYALYCGILQYWALPLFMTIRDVQQQKQQQCVGVLECVSFRTGVPFVNQFYMVLPAALKGLDIECPSSHFHKCKEIRRNVQQSTVDFYDVLWFVRKEHRLPLIQVWVPCMCSSSPNNESFVDECDDSSCSPSNVASRKATQLFCEFTCLDREMKYFGEFTELNYESEAYAVNDWKGLVGRAYSGQKSCFVRDVSKLCISDYPLLHLTRASGLAACFAVPLQLVHPKLQSLVLEVFLPPKWDGDGNVEALMKSILFSLSKKLSELNVDLGLEKLQEFEVKFSHKDDENFIYFDVCQSGSTLISPELPFSSSLELSTLEAGNDHPSTQNTQEISFEIIKQHFGRNLADAAHKLGVSRSTLKRKCRVFGITKWPSHKRYQALQHNQPCPILPTTDGDSEVIQESAEIGRCPNNYVREKEALSTDETRSNIVIKATCRDDIVKFPFCDTSGSEELRAALAKRFRLEIENFKVKYEDEDGWILISCDEDLRFRLDNLESLGQNSLNLLVLPVS